MPAVVISSRMGSGSRAGDLSGRHGGQGTGLSCPACGAPLDPGMTPLDSIVICCACCATLLWDGTFSLAEPTLLASLPARDRARLQALTEAQRARLDGLEPSDRRGGRC